MNQDERPLVYRLYENPVKPEEIEARSFAAIDAEAGDHGFTDDQWVIVRRMIHTTADFSLMQHARFSPDAVEAAAEAMARRAPIYVDANMIKSGISPARLKKVNPAYEREDIHCHVADDDVAREAKAAGLPRSVFAVRKAKDILHGGIAVFGNAPTALMELSRMIAEGEVTPALVIAMPVGFVHVVESKEELMRLGVPYVALEGRRGGSPLAVSTVHSLSILAAEKMEAEKMKGETIES